MLRTLVRFIKSATVLPNGQNVAKLQREVNEQLELIERIHRRNESRNRGERNREPR